MSLQKYCVLALLFVVGETFSQDNYKVDLITQDLTESANVIVRKMEVRFDIKSTSKATYYSYEAITILNKKGHEHAIKALHYDKLIKVKSLKAAIYNEAGELIKRLKPSEFEDRSAVSGYTLYADNRIKIADLSTSTYPFTLEFEYELEYSFLFQIPTFYPIWDEHMSAQIATYKVTFPLGNKPRFSVRNIDQEGTDYADGSEAVSWTFKNLKSFTLEKHGPPWNELFPAIYSAPSQFEYDGYAGNMDTWENFGKWINTLNANRDELSSQTKSRVKELTGELASVEEKCRVLYDFLQNKTRYVSIQLGIGGFQPFDARTVDDVGYGDCKALSNYMVALLKEAGIKSNYTLIRAGKDARPLDHTFPSSQFNHAIVFVPNELDTLWLECTSQTNPFGYLGTFTGDRSALAITESGAQVVRTPASSGDNKIERKLNVVIKGNGSATIDGVTIYSGLQYESDYVNYVASSGNKEQQKWIEDNTSISSFRIQSFSFEEHKGNTPKVIVKSSLSADRLASVSGKRLFVTPNLMSRMPIYYSPYDDRKSDVIVKELIAEYDTIEFNIPENLYPEFIPENKKISNQFGEYEASYIFGSGKMIYRRKLLLYKGRYTAKDYEGLTLFNREITKVDNAKIAFLNKT